MFLEDIALRSDIKYLFLFFLILLSCGKNHKEYAKNVFPYSGFPQEKELKGEVIELDTALFRYPFRIRIEGDKAIVMDLHMVPIIMGIYSNTQVSGIYLLLVDEAILP